MTQKKQRKERKRRNGEMDRKRWKISPKMLENMRRETKLYPKSIQCNYVSNKRCNYALEITWNWLHCPCTVAISNQKSNSVNSKLSQMNSHFSSFVASFSHYNLAKSLYCMWNKFSLRIRITVYIEQQISDFPFR